MGAKPKLRAPTGDTTKERQPLQQSTDRMASGEETDTMGCTGNQSLRGSSG